MSIDSCPTCLHPDVTARAMWEGHWLCIRLSVGRQAALSGSPACPGLMGGADRHSFSAGLVWLELQGSSRLHVRPTLQSTSCVPGMVQA